jgi:hypothetical protein
MWQWSRPGLLMVAAALVAVASAQGSPGLPARVLAASELPGFKLDDQVSIGRSAQAWLYCSTSGRYKDAAALQARGYIAGAREHLYRTQAGVYFADANSNVIEFKTPGGATAELALIMPGLRATSAVKQFAVPGIPGAQAAETAGVNSNGFSIAFGDGRFSYWLTVFYPPGEANHPTRASVIAAAQAFYRRVHHS